MPNMFKCTLASGGGAIVLTVTCDSVFAGQTITCTDGTTTLTQICPSTSSYTVEFKIPNAGIWTISSGTNSTSVTIPSSAELHDIPNGSTITPTDSIQIWLHCANIRDKSYTTITQVLNDASTLQALIASNNAADYMARSTAWASDITADPSAMLFIGLNDYCADSLLADATWLNAICNSIYFESVLNVKVPTMTSATAPSGEVSQSGVFQNQSRYAGWKAFDGDNRTGWLSSNVASTSPINWIGYEFTTPVKAQKLSILYGNEWGAFNITKIEVQTSSDGVTFTTIQEFTPTATTSQNQEDYIININNNKKKYYRIQFQGYNASGAAIESKYAVSIFTAQIYGRA